MPGPGALGPCGIGPCVAPHVMCVGVGVGGQAASPKARRRCLGLHKTVRNWAAEPCRGCMCAACSLGKGRMEGVREVLASGPWFCSRSRGRTCIGLAEDGGGSIPKREGHKPDTQDGWSVVRLM